MIDVSDESIVAMIFHLDNGNTLKITSKECDIANLSETNNYIILARLDGSGSIGKMCIRDSQKSENSIG